MARIGAYGVATIMYGADQIAQITVTTDIAAQLESKDLDFEQAQFTKYLDGILLELSLQYELMVSFGFRNRLTEDLEWTDEFSVLGNDLTHCRIPEARYYRIRVRDPSPTRAWALTTLQLYGRIMGLRRAV